MTTAPMPPAGWYPNPENAAEQRYWDGAAWTAHTAPAVAAAPGRKAGVAEQARGLFGRRASMPAQESVPSPAPDAPLVAAPGAPAATPPLTRVGDWMASLSTTSWIVFGVFALISLIAFMSGGFGSGLLIIALIAFLTALFTLISARPSWARIASRKIAGFIVIGSFLALSIGAGVVGESQPAIDDAAVAQPSPAPSDMVTPGSSATATRTPTPTPTPTGEPDAPEKALAADEDAAVSVADSSATAGTALALLGTLEVKGRAPKTGYDRTGMYGTAWLDVDRNGCDTRNDILARDLEPEVMAGRCKVTSGVLNDPYTATTIDFVRGQKTSLAVQIDHVVALMNSWETGAQQLSQAQRVSLANDPINLLAVDGRSNAQKGAGDAATWLPANKAFRCGYVARQVSVKATYGLWVTQAEHDAIARVLSDCPDEPAVTSAFTPVVVAAEPEPAPAPDPAPAPAPAPDPDPAPAPEPEPAPAPNVSYANCDAVRAAGAAPIYAGDPGYSRKLDRDGDGVGCE